jgi:hypothetical protein
LLLLPLILLQTAAAAPATGASEPPPCAACVTWELTTRQAVELLATPGSLDGLDLLIRSDAGEPDPTGALTELATRGARAGLIVSSREGMPPAARVAKRLIIDPGRRTGEDLDRLAFDVKRMATEIRAGNPTVEVGLETSPDTWEGLNKRGVGPYVDFLVGPTRLGGASRRAGWPAWLETAPLRSVETVRVLAEVLPADLTPLPTVTVSCPPAQGGCDSRVFLHPRTLDAIAIVTPRGPVRELTVRPGALGVDLFPLDPDSGVPIPSALAPRSRSSGATLDLPPGLGPFVLRIRGWAGAAALDRFAAGVEVVGERRLTVEEIVARHQAAAARQRQVVDRLISSGSMLVTFQVPGLAAPMTLTSDIVVYEGGGAREIEQRSVRLNGVEQAGDAGGVPRLPILEPERVSAPPLVLTLDEAYRYRLEGREVAEGQDCYVVAFEPASGTGTSFRGRAWIAAKGFAMVRAEAVQTGLRGSIVSSQQRDVFAAVSVGDVVAWLPWRSEVHQVYEGAGHRTPIDRVLAFARLEPNPSDFAARRAAAHASSSILVADTPAGYRYLRRSRSPAEAGEPRRQAAGKASRVRAVAVGVLIAPNISRPLPFAGVSYVDFDFLGTGAQVNGFFGGVFGRLAWAVPSVGGSRWQLEGSAFAILASYNDRAFAGGVERYEENLRQRPARLSVGAVRPLSARARVRVGYELDYTRLARGDTTAADFVVPVSPVVHGVRVALEAQRGAWSAGVWWNGARRQRWPAWGFPDSEAGGAGIQRFGASAGRGFVLSSRSVARLDAAWMGGRGLDRFSRYAFDGFENRLRGYPTAAVRYDRGAVAHGVVTWNAPGRVRLDGFLDVARVRDPGFGPRARTYTGAGAALEVPLPLRALASVEWGYGFQARGPAGEAGTHVVKVTAYKVF